jgi:transglutaminase-like putative cysteine protease/Flp pilus assembly protein TadD
MKQVDPSTGKGRAPHFTLRLTPPRVPLLAPGARATPLHLVSPRTVTLSCVLALLPLVGLVSRAQADLPDSSLSRLAELRHAVTAASGPAKYVALRNIWSEWDESDPDEIEEVLHEVANDAAQTPPIRAYAELLEAYARRRRGDLGGARARIKRLGYIGQWMMLGPFDNDGKAGFSTQYEPEAEVAQPLNLAHEYDGKDHRAARWRALPAVSPYAWVDFGAFIRPLENVCVYVTTFVRDARIPARGSRAVSIWTGATGAERVLWNGQEALTDDKYRDLDSDRFAANVLLQGGWNRILAKVCGDDRTPMLSLRVAAADGSPDDHIQVDPDPIHSTPEGGATAGTLKMAIGKGGVEGPAQAFEHLAGAHEPANLEAYARYLDLTGADDPAEHRARELARRAADSAPTVPRLLLAAKVAESRNQRASWIEKAEAMVLAGRASPHETIQVLLARADCERAGVNARDAVPYYDKVLALDPDSVPAVLAKVDLYQEAGLPETALANLERALARRPTSVGLLRAGVGLLRDEGRETEAGEMAARYAALRFDDPTFIRAHVDLAVARRDPASASHWIERLLSANPGGAVALQSAAQAWMRLGDRPRAIAAYKQALDEAPDDTEAMRQLATLSGLVGDRAEQLRLLKRVLELMPQAKEIREELAHMGPVTPRADERYARSPEEFLAARTAPAAGQVRRSLVDLQVTTVFPNGLASRFHQVVFQPLTDAAAAESREYEFTYETDSEIVQIRAARIYRKDGRVDESTENGAGAMADDPALAIYTTARRYYVRFPRLEPGDVVELQFRVDDVATRNAFADYFGEVVYMQGTEPIRRSEYVLVTPKARQFFFNQPRVPGLERTVVEDGDQRIFHFLARDLAPVQEEALQPPWSEILGHINVSTYKTWEDVGRWYWGLIKDQFIPDDDVRRRAEILTQGLTGESAKVRAIYDYVVQKTRYVALEFGIHGYKPYRCAQIFARGFGDCKDKATLVVTMLRALGIQATPVVVRTGNKGDIETTPASLAPFDHMIAYVPSLDWYLDGTAEYSGSLELPAMDRGALALQVNEGHAKLVHLPDPPAGASISSYRIDANVALDGAGLIDWHAAVGGVEAAEWRARFHAQATRRQRAEQMFASLLPGSEVTAFDSSNLEDVEAPVNLHTRGKVPQFARVEGDALSIPVGRKEHMVRDYAPTAVRALDVRVPAQWTEEDEWSVHTPAGSRVTNLPVSTSGVSPFGTYSLAVEAGAGTIHVKTTVTLSRTRVTASEYPAFRSWCEGVDSALGQRATVVVK